MFAEEDAVVLAAVQVVLLVFAPLLVTFLAKRVKPLGWIGPTLMCYLIGIALANSGLPIDTDASMLLSEVAVLLAIPLLLYSTDFIRWLRLARSAVVSFLLACLAIMVSAAAATLIFGPHLPEAAKLGGMYVGCYTGGTANMSAIGLALGVQDETFVLANAADVIAGGVYLVFLMTVGQRVLLKFLPAFKPVGAVVTRGSGGPGSAALDARAASGPSGKETAASLDTSGRPATASTPPPTTTGVKVKQVLIALGVALLIVGVSVGLSFLLTGDINETLVLLSITTLGIAASFVKRIRGLEGASDFALYLLLVFCVSIGTIADFRNLQGSPYIFGMCFVTMFGAIIIHVALAALFRIDADTVIITSTAAVYSPPFVPTIAAVLRNPEVIVSGLTTGLVGYAVGNYLGIALSYLLR